VLFGCCFFEPHSSLPWRQGGVSPFFFPPFFLLFFSSWIFCKILSYLCQRCSPSYEVQEWQSFFSPLFLDKNHPSSCSPLLPHGRRTGVGLFFPPFSQKRRPSPPFIRPLPRCHFWRRFLYRSGAPVTLGKGRRIFPFLLSAFRAYTFSKREDLASILPFSVIKKNIPFFPFFGGPRLLVIPNLRL